MTEIILRNKLSLEKDILLFDSVIPVISVYSVKSFLREAQATILSYMFNAYTKKGSNGTSIDIKISLVVKGVKWKKI